MLKCNTNHTGYVRLHFHILAFFVFGFNRVGHFVFSSNFLKVVCSENGMYKA